MTRQNIRPNPAEKLFEAYMDFSGGRNSELSNEKLRDNEFPILENVDLSGRGSAKRRAGRRYLGDVTGTAQGIFFYYKQTQTTPIIIVAISGKLYYLGDVDTIQLLVYQDYTLESLQDEIFDALSKGIDFTEIPITDGGSPWTFQNTLPIEAVQYKEDMFIATGTKLVELKHDGMNWVAKTVTPYTPTVMEAIYIGTNALATNPDAYVQDGTGTLEVVGIKPAKRSGTVNEALMMTTYVNKPSELDATDYKWEYKKSSATSWILGADFTLNKKTWDFKVEDAGSYDIRCTIRKNGTTTPTPYYTLTSFLVNQVEAKTNTDLPVSSIQSCRKINLHWDRILLSGDDTRPYQMYISDLLNPRYIPVTNTINFDVAGKQEPITSIVRFQDMLVVFTKTTIQTLTGKSVEDYRRNLIHDGIGCIASRSAQVVGNYVMFLSHEGVHQLKPNLFKLETMNVQRIDFPIKSELPKESEACAIVADGQYWICMPQAKVVYRLYYDNGMWVKDVSTRLNIFQFIQYGNDVYNLTTDGKVYIHDNTIYRDDDDIYTMIAETKAFDLSSSFNQKKLKRLYVLAASTDAKLYVTVKADSALVLNPESGYAYVDANGEIQWIQVLEPNMHFYSGTTFGTWIMGLSPFGDSGASVQKASIRGKCRRTTLRYEHKQNYPCEIFGFGLEFKMKKP